MKVGGELAGEPWSSLATTAAGPAELLARVGGKSELCAAGAWGAVAIDTASAASPVERAE